MARPWFDPKEIGYGATPSTWEGWVATLVFVVFVAASVSLVDPRPHGLAEVLGLHRLPLFRNVVLSLPSALGMILVESLLFTAFARWKSSGPWLRR